MRAWRTLQRRGGARLALMMRHGPIAPARIDLMRPAVPDARDCPQTRGIEPSAFGRPCRSRGSSDRGRSQRNAPETARPRGRSIWSLAVTYSGMACGHTTIGAGRFHFRVRNGIGWFPLAMAARQTVRGRCAGPHRAGATASNPDLPSRRLAAVSMEAFFVPTLSRSRWIAPSRHHPLARLLRSKHLEVIWSSLTGN